MTSDRVKEVVRNLSEQGSYRNTREIIVGSIPFTARDVLITAPLFAALNVYLVGGTGEGKSQLATDLAGYFGESFAFMEGRPDFEPSELLKEINPILFEVISGKRQVNETDLLRLTENVGRHLYYVDELNRAKPIVMNYFFNFFDGKLYYKGKPIRLGNNGYSVGFASGNLGNGAYVGVSDIDRALKDRMHMIIPLDDPDFQTEPEDDIRIFSGKKDPRVTLPDASKSQLEGIVEAHNEFLQRDVPAVLPVLGVYLHKGLDHLERTKRHSKRAVASKWPNIQGINQSNHENKIMPLSKRAALAAIGLSQSLEMIAEAKGYEGIDSVDLLLDALKFIIPYSGVLSRQYVEIEHNEDTYAAFDDAIFGIRSDISEKKEDLLRAIAIATCGERDDALLDKISAPGFSGEWFPVRKAIEAISMEPTFTHIKLVDIKEEYKKPEPPL